VKKSDIEVLGENDYLTVQEAAVFMGVCTQCVYKAIYRKKLEFKKIKVLLDNGFMKWRTYTTKCWIANYKAIMHDKDTMRWNGRPMFIPKEGKLSTHQAYEYLGMTKNMLAHYTRTGQLKYTRKGYYYVYDVEDLDALRESIEEKAKLLKTG
jgi:hypothetical protein